MAGMSGGFEIMQHADFRQFNAGALVAQFDFRGIGRGPRFFAPLCRRGLLLFHGFAFPSARPAFILAEMKAGRMAPGMKAGRISAAESGPVFTSRSAEECSRPESKLSSADRRARGR